MDPLVTVMREQKVKGWPDDDGMPPRYTDRAYVLPLSQALQRTYTTDAHLAQYITHNNRRLKTAAVQHEISARIDVLVLDIDCKETHGTKEPTPDTWRADVRMKMLALRAAHPGMYMYDTKGGSRIIYRQPVPYFISTPEDAADWKRDYAITAAYVARVFGIEADPACADWTRLFRLPHATREQKQQPENWALAGDPCNVAALWFEPTEEDREAAERLLPRAFENKSVTHAQPRLSDGQGLLYHALRNRGHIVRPFGRAAFVVRCPNEAQHSSGKVGDRSTVLYLPNFGQDLGNIHCLHAHCQHIRPVDWLRHFAEHELNAAREAAGLTRRSA